MELTNIKSQTVNPNCNILFSEVPISDSECIEHVDGSSIITLCGNTEKAKARFLIMFSANVSVFPDEELDQIVAAVVVNGEPLLATQTVVAPVSYDQNNISTFAIIDVKKNDCVNIAIRNISKISINSANSNLIIIRTA